jgi:hypothetical protein
MLSAAPEFRIAVAHHERNGAIQLTLEILDPLRTNGIIFRCEKAVTFSLSVRVARIGGSLDKKQANPHESHDHGGPGDARQDKKTHDSPAQT